MPGPGGGSRGGGGFRGGSHGGGYHGGGCFGGLAGLVMLPIILIVCAIAIILSSFGTAILVFKGDGRVVAYDENAFQDYANAQYSAEFGGSTAYEDNLLLVFLADGEEFYDYYYIAFVGDHIDTKINYLFGSNKTAIQMTEGTVNAALKNFTDTTGIPIVVVVEDITDVFEKELPAGSIIAVIIALGLLLIAIVLIVINIRKRKRKDGKKDPEKRRYDDRGNRI